MGRLSPRRETLRKRSRVEDTAWANPPRTGTFLRVPYDWRRPTIARAKSRWWNPDDARLFTPKVFGWGWDINLARLPGRNPKRRVIALVVISIIAILINLLDERKRKEGTLSRFVQ